MNLPVELPDRSGIPPAATLERLGAEFLASKLSEVAVAYVEAAGAGGIIRDYALAALDRLREVRPDLALRTLEHIERVHLDAAEEGDRA
jgi:hypothetical protein